MKAIWCIAVVLAVIFIQDINAQGVGYCHCGLEGVSIDEVQNCNSSGICSIHSEQSYLGCVVQRIEWDKGTRIFQRCLDGDLTFSLFCSGNTLIESGPYKGYHYKVVRTEPLEEAVCCTQNSLCNTLEIFEEITAYFSTATAETTTTALSSGHGLNSTAQTTGGVTEVPMYALVVIPTLAVIVIVITLIIVILLCFHFQVQPKKIRKFSNAETPTITSGDSSSYGEQSLNDIFLEYSGSGAGLPLLIQRSIAGQISLQELLGKGRYGAVWKGSYKCDEVAVKIFHTREEASWAHEVDIYQTSLFRHPNILRFIASDNKDIGVQVELWLITEFCEFGSLYDFLVQTTLEPSVMLHVAYTAACGLDYLHSEIFGHEAKPAIVHRDLKSRNILVKADYTCCIGDLGLALRYNRSANQVEDPPTKRVGTKRYLAPEIIDESILFKHFDSYKKADVYSFGLILWEITRRGMVDGVAEDYQMPFQNLVPTDPTFEDMKKTVVIDKRRPMLPNRWTQMEVFRGMSKLIQQCWLDDSDARLTSLRIKKTLRGLQQSCTAENKKDKEQSA